MKNCAVLCLFVGLISVSKVAAYGPKIFPMNLESLDTNLMGNNQTPQSQLINGVNVILWLMSPNPMQQNQCRNLKTHKPNNQEHAATPPRRIIPTVTPRTIQTTTPKTTNTTSKSIFDEDIDNLQNYPMKYVSETISRACKTEDRLRLGEGNTPEDSDIFMEACVPCSCVNSSLAFPWVILEQINKSTNKVFIYVNGLTTKNDDTIKALKQAFLCRNDSRLVVIDIGSHVRTLRAWYSMDLERIGAHLANTLVQLEDQVPISKIHLIGHSLGAHIVGLAARKFRESTGRTIPRITALDPANLCFLNKKKGLHVSDAKFVDVIHTNPSVLGFRYPMGTADFYPGGLGARRNGCDSVICSHLRAVKFYAETVVPGNEGNFMGVPCSSMRKMSEQVCTSNVKNMIPMGYAMPTSAKAYYFMDVNDKSPYGQNAIPQPLDAQNCSKCIPI